MLISDGKDQLLFDAPFTRAHPLHWLNLVPLRSDEELLKQIISRHEIDRLRGIFVSHHHVDHAVDVGAMAQLTGAEVYGDENLRRLTPHAATKFRRMEEGHPISMGSFSITPFSIPHGSIPFEFLFMGEVPVDFDFSLYDYKEGATWFYLITHGKKSILWNGSTGNAIQKLREHGAKSEIDLYVLGMGALSLKEQVKEMNGDHPFKSFIPVHFDNFFFPYDPEKFHLLPFSSIEEDIEKIQRKHPTIQWIQPKLGEIYDI